MTIPVKQIYPRTDGDKETIYLKHVITNPNYNGWRFYNVQ